VLISLPAPAELSPERHLERREDENGIQNALTLPLARSARGHSPLPLPGDVVRRDRADLWVLRGSGQDEVFRAMEVLKKALTGDARGGDRCLNVV